MCQQLHKSWLNLCLALSGMLPAMLKAAPAAEGTLPVAADPLAMGNLIQLTLGMLVVLAILGGLAWLMRRSGRFGTGMSGALRVLGGVPMGSRERIVLLQVGDQQLLIGVAPGRIQTLHVLPEPITEAAAATEHKGGFAQALEMARGKKS